MWPPFVRYPGISETAKTDLRAYAAAGNNVSRHPLLPDSSLFILHARFMVVLAIDFFVRAPVRARALPTQAKGVRRAV